MVPFGLVGAEVGTGVVPVGVVTGPGTGCQAEGSGFPPVVAAEAE